MVLSLTPKRTTIAFVVIVAASICRVDGLSTNPSSSSSCSSSSRRHVLESLLGGVSTAAVLVGTTGGIDNTNMIAQAGEMDVDSFLQSGGVAMPMGVSGQAGKSKPITNIIFREDGIDISRNSKTGNVIAEILVQKAGTKQEEYNDENLMSVITSFSAPYPLATGMVYDVECRDSKTGDAAFLAVSPPINDISSTSSSSVADIKDKDIIKSLFGLRGRFSFYGVPTDVKIKKSVVIENKDGGTDSNNYKILDVNFSTLTQASIEVPRKSRIVATIPKGSNQIVMLVGSSSAPRWANNGSEKTITSTVESFRATPSPKSDLKLRRARSIQDEPFE